MKRVAHYDKYNYRAFWQGRDYEWQADRLALERLLDKIDYPREKLIDVGCGFGRNAPSYALMWKGAILFDPSRRILDEAKANNRKFHNLVFVRGVAEKLPFAQSSFDTVVCIRVLHHLSDPEKAVREFSRVLRKNGCLVLEVANKRHIKAVIESFWSGGFWRVLDHSSVDKRSAESVRKKTIAFINYNPETIRRLLEKNGFAVEEVLSVSNLRGLPVARLLSTKVVLGLERALQPVLGRWWFGPSIYFLARKTCLSIAPIRKRR